MVLLSECNFNFDNRTLNSKGKMLKRILENSDGKPTVHFVNTKFLENENSRKRVIDSLIKKLRGEVEESPAEQVPEATEEDKNN